MFQDVFVCVTCPTKENGAMTAFKTHEKLFDHLQTSGHLYHASEKMKNIKEYPDPERTLVISGWQPASARGFAWKDLVRSFNSKFRLCVTGLAVDFHLNTMLITIAKEPKEWIFQKNVMCKSRRPYEKEEKHSYDIRVLSKLSEEEQGHLLNGTLEKQLPRKGFWRATKMESATAAPGPSSSSESQRRECPRRQSPSTYGLPGKQFSQEKSSTKAVQTENKGTVEMATTVHEFGVNGAAEDDTSNDAGVLSSETQTAFECKTEDIETQKEIAGKEQTTEQQRELVDPVEQDDGLKHSIELSLIRNDASNESEQGRDRAAALTTTKENGASVEQNDTKCEIGSTKEDLEIKSTYTVQENQTTFPGEKGTSEKLELNTRTDIEILVYCNDELIEMPMTMIGLPGIFPDNAVFTAKLKKIKKRDDQNE